ncbi:MAG: hypothetical protein WEB04_01150 [Dehalococcoidia bacterium]
MATAPPTDPPPKVQHKILGLVVHGVGEQSAGSTLRSFVKDFYPLIRKRIDPKAGIDVTPLDDEGLPKVTISFRNEARDHRYELIVREVHWAKAFAPPSLGGLLAGMITLLTSWFGRVENVQSSEFVNQVANAPGPVRHTWPRRLIFIAWFVAQLLVRAVRNAAIVFVMLIFSPFAFVIATVLLIGGRMGWARMPPAWLRSLVAEYAKFQPSVVELAIVLASPFVALLYLALLLLESIGPVSAVLPEQVSKARSAIATILTSYLGDVWIYASQPWEAAQIRTRFESRFKRLVEDERDGAEAMFVIAHSLGCPVSYEGLSGHRMTDFINLNFREEATRNDTRPALYYFTVGSALPAIWAAMPEEEEGRLYRALPNQVHWEDFYSEYDPVRMGLICDPVPPPYDPIPPDPANRDDLVVNQMDMFAEHTAYWNNAEQVLAPMLDTITRGQFAGRLALDRKARQHRVRVLSAWKALAWLTFPAVMAAMVYWGAAGWAPDIFDVGLLDKELKEFALTPYLWAAVAAAFAVGVYSTIVKWIWDGWDQRVKYEP